MEEEKEITTEKKSFFVGLINKIEDFNFFDFKKNQEDKKTEQKKQREIDEELRDSETTLDDVSQQRKSHVSLLMKKVLLLSFGIVLVTGAVILSFQNNEQKERPKIDTTNAFKDSSSFGGIEDKDYFAEQNSLNQRVQQLQEQANIDRQELKELILAQSKNYKDMTDSAITELERRQNSKLESKLINRVATNEEHYSKPRVKNEKFFNPNSDFDENGIIRQDKGAKLDNGRIVFPVLNNPKPQQQNYNYPQQIQPQESIFGSTNQTNRYIDTKAKVRIEEGIDISKSTIKTNYSTTRLKPKEAKKFKPFKLDLTKSMAKVTLLEGVKAAASFAGLENTTPALMIIEDVLYTANDTVADLRGCFLGGAAIGNINTSRIEIFGTSISCIIEAENGKKYKVDQTFTNNKVWIKGEDGGTGIQGQIVDSSGKLLAKSAAVGFLQGLSNYLQANSTTTQNVLTGDGQVSQVQALQNSFKVGAAQGVNSGFELIIKKYEKILDGYFPYVDSKGGRKNLTVVFDGKMELEVTEYVEPNINELRRNNLSRGYQE